MIADDVPVLLLAPVLIAPGTLVLVGASRLRRQALREVWTDAQWLRRFRGALRAGLVPATTARGHVREVEQTLASAGSAACTEFGHPLVLAREISLADGTARARRWWVSAIVGVGTPLLIAALVLVNGSWKALTVPLAVFFALNAVIILVVRWKVRPWGNTP